MCGYVELKCRKPTLPDPVKEGCAWVLELKTKCVGASLRADRHRRYSAACNNTCNSERRWWRSASSDLRLERCAGGVNLSYLFYTFCGECDATEDVGGGRTVECCGELCSDGAG
jgi:hypothetical protein